MHLREVVAVPLLSLTCLSPNHDRYHHSSQQNQWLAVTWFISGSNIWLEFYAYKACDLYKQLLWRNKNLCNSPCHNQTICPAGHYGTTQTEQKAEGGPFCPVCLVQDICFGLVSPQTIHVTLQVHQRLCRTKLFCYQLINIHILTPQTVGKRVIQALLTLQNEEN